MTKKKKHLSFQSFYASELQPFLARLERARKMRLLPYILAGVVALPAIALAFLYPQAVNVLFVWVLLAFGLAKLLDDTVFEPHKTVIKMHREVVPRLINYAYPGMTHRYPEYMSAADFIDSELFSLRFNNYTGRNWFRASGRDFNLTFSWLKVEYISPKSSDANKNGRSLVFMGWFFAARFRKRFTGEILLLPDFVEANLGWFGRMIQEITLPRGVELLLMEDAKFEKHFKVLSTSQNDARHILTPMVMQEAGGLAARLKTGMCISFKRNSMFAAIPVQNDFFDTMLWQSMTDPTPLRELYHAVKGMNRLTEAVARGTKVWKS